MRYLCFKKDRKIMPVWGGYNSSRTSNVETINNPNTACLFMCYKGEMDVNLEGCKYLYNTGAFYVLFPDTKAVVNVRSSSEVSDFWCHFLLPQDYFIVESDNIEEVQADDLCVLPEFSKIDDYERIFVFFSHFVNELLNLRTKPDYKVEICDSYTKILLSSLADAALRYNGEGKRRISIDAIFHWLGKNAKNGINASDAAKALNYNPDYLNQLIKKESGMTLTRYLNTLRIMEAKQMLLSSDMTVCQIAAAVGFADEKYFMKTFKLYEKVTPAQYRNSLLRKY